MKIFTRFVQIIKILAGIITRFVSFYINSVTTHIQQIKTVFMQNFFTLIKKILTSILYREHRTAGLNVGWQPGCCSGIGGTENIFPDQKNDVAENAASFAFIPQPIYRSEKKSFMKRGSKRSELLAIAFVITSLFFVIDSNAQFANITVNTTAVGSSNGSWARTGASAPFTYTFTPNANSANLSVTEIVDALTGTAATLSGPVSILSGNYGNVIINTAFGGGSSAGNVTFSTALTAAEATGRTQVTLTINAGGNITVSSAINLTGGTGNNGGTGGTGGTGGSSSNNFTPGGTGGNAGSITINGPGGITISQNLSAIGGTGGAGTGFNGTQGSSGANGNFILNDGSVNLTTGGGANDGQSGGVFSGGTLTSSGTGILFLGGNNTYVGLTTISAGTLRLGIVGSGGNGPLGTTAAGTTVSSGAVLDLNGITIANAESLTLNGAGLTASPAGALTNTGGNASYSGAITLGSASTITTTSSGTLTLSGTLATAGTSVTLNGIGTGTYSGVISGTGSVVKNGTGTWTLSGNNTFSGLTTISAGTIKLGATGSASGGGSGPLGATAAGTTVSSGAVLDLNGFTLAPAEPLTLNGTGLAASPAGALTNTGGNASYSGAITLGSASTITVTSSGTLTVSGGMTTAGNTVTLDGLGTGSYSGTISGSGGVQKNGTGTWTLSGANTFSGLTTINTGILKLGVSSASVTSGPLGAASTGTVVNSGGALDMNGFSLTSAATEPLTLNGTGISGAGALTNSSATASTFAGLITLGSSSTIASNSGKITISNTGSIGGSGTLTLGGSANSTLNSNIATGSGGLTVSGTGSWTWTPSGSASNFTGATTINTGATLILNPAGTPPQTITIGSSFILSGGILSTSGIGANDVINAGTLTLSSSSSINLGANIHQLNFANSNGSWTGTLTINNWTGNYGVAGTAGQIFVGTDNTGLGSSQLNQVSFTNFPGTSELLTASPNAGQLVPFSNNPILSITGTNNFGTICKGTAAPTITYTITNNGGSDAQGISISFTGTNNTDFVAGAPTSTTVPANGGAVTFVVTFTPTTTSGESATINVSSTTLTSNSPTLNISGTGGTDPDPSFTYPNSQYCIVLPSNQSLEGSQNSTPNFTGFGTTSYNVASGTGLVFVSSTTGQIDLTNSAAGTYTITNTASANGCNVTSAAQTVKIFADPIATISLAQPAYCKSDINQEPITVSNFTAGIVGSYAVSPTSGLALTVTPSVAQPGNQTATIQPSASQPGTYTITYTFAGGAGLCSNTATTTVTITQMANGNISYSPNQYCTNGSNATVTNGVTGAQTGASFSYAVVSGGPTLALNTSTGAVTSASSSPGVYNVTYNVPAIGGCNAYSTPSTPITILAPQTTSISYIGTPFCKSDVSAEPVTTPSITGGTYSSTTGLSINSSTGAITPSTSTTGTYTVTYTFSAGGCTNTATTSVTITQATTTPILNTTTICPSTTTLNITLGTEAIGTPINVVDNTASGSPIIATVTKTGTTANYTVPSNIFITGHVISLTSLAANKCISAASNSVTIIGIPSQPAAISGNTSTCPSI